MEAAKGTHTDLFQSRGRRHSLDGRWILNGSHLLQDTFCEKLDLWPRYWTWPDVNRVMRQALDWFMFERKHGFIPWRIHRELKVYLKKFTNCRGDVPFDNVTQELERCGLGQALSNSASDFLGSMGMSRDLQRTLLEPCVQEIFGISLEQAFGVHAVLAAGAIRSTHSVTAARGNQRFIERMIEESEAEVRLNTLMMEEQPGKERRFEITIRSKDDEKEVHLEYDAIVMASGGSLGSPITTYKTIFATEDNREYNFIGIKSGAIPRSVLFATNDQLSENPPMNLTSLTTYPSFYIDRTGCVHDDECDQFSNIYITESTTPLPDERLNRLAGVDRSIIWSRSASWQRNLPFPLQIDANSSVVQLEDMYFFAGSFLLDSMEMSCRAGKNIALKILAPEFAAMTSTEEYRSRIGSRETIIDKPTSGMGPGRDEL